MKFDDLFDYEEDSAEAPVVTVDPATQATLTFGYGNSVVVNIADYATLLDAVNANKAVLGIVIDDASRLNCITSTGRFAEKGEPIEPGMIYRLTDSVDDKGLPD